MNLRPTQLLTLLVMAILLPLPARAPSLGLFEGQADVGAVTPPGTATFAADTYTLTSAGANLWGAEDGFHFVWKKMSGDGTLTADIDFPETGAEHNPHRKAILIFRQCLDAGSAYADAALHGVGLTALQFRREAGAMTEDLELSTTTGAAAAGLEKRGDTLTMYVASEPGGTAASGRRQRPASSRRTVLRRHRPLLA